jgi:hypothetical protein
MSAELLAQDPVSGLRRRGSELLYRVIAAVREAWGQQPHRGCALPRASPVVVESRPTIKRSRTAGGDSSTPTDRQRHLATRCY